MTSTPKSSAVSTTPEGDTAVVTRSCSFAPGGPTIDPAGAPVVDAPAALRELRVPLPLRIPAVPAGWRSNSVGQDRVDILVEDELELLQNFVVVHLM